MSQRPAQRAAGRHRAPPGSRALGRTRRGGRPRLRAGAHADPSDSLSSAVTMGVIGIGMLLAAALWPASGPATGTASPARAADRGASLAEPAPPLTVELDEEPQDRIAQVTCDPMSLRERVAQTILAGIPGTTMSDAIERVVTRHAASVLLFTTNISSADQVRALTRAMHRAAPRRLSIAVDEEGGRVSRLGARGVVDRLPSARTLAATESIGDVRDMARRLGRQMRDLGIDWNLAPVLDVTDAPSSTVIGDRSFSGTTETAAEYARAFAEGLRSAGVLATGKHFPGEGGTSVDPHETLPTITAPRSVLERRDVAAFAHAAPELDAVMAAHVVYRALDPDLPAGLSPATVELLREAVGFDGVLMTDALEMDAITEHWEVPEAAEMAIAAGVDVVLVGRWPDVAPTSSRLRDAVRDGRISAARFDEAAGRVLAMKGHTSEQIGCLLG